MCSKKKKKKHVLWKDTSHNLLAPKLNNMFIELRSIL